MAVENDSFSPRIEKRIFEATILFSEAFVHDEEWASAAMVARENIEIKLPRLIRSRGLDVEINIIAVRRGSIIITFAAIYTVVAQLDDFRRGANIIIDSARELLERSFGPGRVGIEMRNVPSLSTREDPQFSRARPSSFGIYASAALNVLLLVALVWSVVAGNGAKGDDALAQLKESVADISRRVERAELRAEMSMLCAAQNLERNAETRGGRLNLQR